MRNPFAHWLKPKVSTSDGSFYTAGRVFQPGAEGMAFETVYLHPLQDQYSGIVPARSIRTRQPPQVYQTLALPTQPLLAGFVAGSFRNSPLYQNIDGDAPVQS